MLRANTKNQTKMYECAKNKQMHQVFLNPCIYAEQKINMALKLKLYHS